MPWSWKITTTSSPALKCGASCSSPAIADPAELPAKMPSSRAMRLVMIAASRSVTFSKWSMTLKSTFCGRKSSPMPSVM